MTESRSNEEVKQILGLIRCIVLSGSRDLVVKIKGILTALDEKGVLNWKKYLDEAKRIIDALGEVTVKTLHDDGDLHRTVMEYSESTEDYLNLLSKTEIKLLIQGNLVATFLKCLEDETLIKAAIAEACVNSNWWDLSNEKELRIEVLKKSEHMLKNDSLDWQNPHLAGAVSKSITSIVDSFIGDGTSVNADENKLLVSIFLTVSEGGQSVRQHWYLVKNKEIPNVKMRIWNGALRYYVRLHEKSATLTCIFPVMPNILRWTQIAIEESHEAMTNCLLCILTTIGHRPPAEFSCFLPELLDLLLKSDKCQDLCHFINKGYSYNAEVVHKRLQDMFKVLNEMTSIDKTNIPLVLHAVSEHHPEIFTKSHIESLFDQIKKGSPREHYVVLMIIKNISKECPGVLVDFFPTLCDVSVFSEDSLIIRSYVMVAIASENRTIGLQAVDYLIKCAMCSEPPTSITALSAVSTLIETHRDCVLPYKPKLEKLQKTCSNAEVKQLVNSMIQILKTKEVHRGAHVDTKDETSEKQLQHMQQHIEERDLRARNWEPSHNVDLCEINNSKHVSKSEMHKSDKIQNKERLDTDKHEAEKEVCSESSYAQIRPTAKDKEEMTTRYTLETADRNRNAELQIKAHRLKNIDDKSQFVRNSANDLKSQSCFII